jgi:hypothetical protein
LKVEEWLLAWRQPRRERKENRSHTMKVEEKNRKKAMAQFRQVTGREQMRHGPVVREVLIDDAPEEKLELRFFELGAIFGREPP